MRCLMVILCHRAASVGVGVRVEARVGGRRSIARESRVK